MNEIVSVILVLFEVFFLVLGIAILGFSVAQKKVPKGILEWVVLAIDIGICINWFRQM